MSNEMNDIDPTQLSLEAIHEEIEEINRKIDWILEKYPDHPDFNNNQTGGRRRRKSTRKKARKKRRKKRRHTRK